MELGSKNLRGFLPPLGLSLEMGIVLLQYMVNFHRCVHASALPLFPLCLLERGLSILVIVFPFSTLTIFFTATSQSHFHHRRARFDAKAMSMAVVNCSLSKMFLPFRVNRSLASHTYLFA